MSRIRGQQCVTSILLKASSAVGSRWLPLWVYKFTIFYCKNDIKFMREWLYNS